MNESPDGKVQGVVPLPSADLIKYRFDHIDTTLSKMDLKIDSINSTAVPRLEVDSRLEGINKKLAEHTSQIAKLKETDDIQQGFIEANKERTSKTLLIASMIIVLLSAIIGAILTRR